MSYAYRSAFGSSGQATVSTALQEALFDLTALSQMVKQAHWNVIGPAFDIIHKNLKEVYGAIEEAIDTVAVRCTALGMPPSGQCDEVASHTKLLPMPSGFLLDRDVIDEFTVRFNQMVTRLAIWHDEVAGFDTQAAEIFRSLRARLKQHLNALLRCK